MPFYPRCFTRSSTAPFPSSWPPTTMFPSPAFTSGIGSQRPGGNPPSHASLCPEFGLLPPLASSTCLSYDGRTIIIAPPILAPRRDGKALTKFEGKESNFAGWLTKLESWLASAELGGIWNQRVSTAATTDASRVLQEELFACLPLSLFSRFSGLGRFCLGLGFELLLDVVALFHPVITPSRITHLMQRSRPIKVSPS